MPPRAFWHQMTWPEIAAAAAAGAVAVVPAGSVEQHGLRLPTAADTLVSKRLAESLVAAMPERSFIVAPPFRYTIARPNAAYPGTINLSGETLIRVTHDVVAEILRNGFLRILFLNGHMESVPFLMEGAELALRERRAGETSGRPVLVWVNWWDLISDGLIRDVFGDKWPGWEAEHAGLTETSLLLHLLPDIVRPAAPADNAYERLPYTVFPGPDRARPKSGSFADPAGASADIGRRLAEEIVAGLKRLVEAEF